MDPANVEKFLLRLNAAWLGQDYDAVAAHYHPEVILLPPDAGEPIEGREAVCESYKDFHAACTIERFAITDLKSWTFANGHGSPVAGVASNDALTTMVHMRFDIDYRLRAGNQDFSEQGLEVYTLQTPMADPARDKPRIVWRAQFAL